MNNRKGKIPKSLFKSILEKQADRIETELAAICATSMNVAYASIRFGRFSL